MLTRKRQRPGTQNDSTDDPFFSRLLESSPSAYAGLLAKHQIEPARFLMVGNSMRSDVLPVVELGG